jgi:hypothetical protein
LNTNGNFKFFLTFKWPKKGYIPFWKWEVVLPEEKLPKNILDQGTSWKIIGHEK